MPMRDKNISMRAKITYYTVSFMENVFYRHGKFIAAHPVSTILIALVCCVLGSLGFLNVHMESQPEKLWIPQDSDFVKTRDWQKENYPNDLRVEMVMYEAQNVLQPQYLRKMFKIKEMVKKMVTSDSKGRNFTQEDLCFRVPALGNEMQETMKRVKNSYLNEEEPQGLDWSLQIHRSFYCMFYEMIPTSCLYLGILDIWPANASVVNLLTKQDIINGVNSAVESAAYRYPLNFTKFLGGVTRNESGHIVGARATLDLWHMEVNRTELSFEVKKLSVGLSSEVDEGLYNWEEGFINLVVEEMSDVPQGLRMWPNAFRSFKDISEDTIFGDVSLLVVGVFVLLIYVFLMLGKFNWVETRPVLSGFGILSIALSVFFSFGMCAGMVIVYSPIHSILPLIFLGLGVDDMFIIVQSLETLEKSPQEETSATKLAEKMGKVLARSGLAITVTSLTDFMAFGIGSFTGLPALQSFCIYAAVGMLSLYLMQLTFFFAVFTLDQTRLEADRNGFFWCIKHRHWSPSSCSQNNYCQMFFEKLYAPFLLKFPVKVCVLVGTAVLTILCIWGAANLRQEFNIIWFIPKSTYLFSFLVNIVQYYPETGFSGIAYIDKVDLPSELPNFKWLVDNLRRSEWISDVDSWYDPLVEYVVKDTGVDIERETITEEFFFDALNRFLFSPSGTKFQGSFYFNDTLTCLGSAPKILATKLSYIHNVIEDRNQQILAMDQTKTLLSNANFSGFATCFSISYNNWETNKLIVEELARNLSLALAAVFVMTTFLIVNIWSSFLVLLCVLLTLVDVMALMNWWGLTIDTVTCISMVLTVGLSVDYSAHVALHFMKVKGTRDERITKTLAQIGPPVFNGALSTFLAFVLLAKSDSHVFESFFKIFFGVFVYGLYHGLAFLPVVLSIIGPAPYLEFDGKKTPKYNSPSKQTQEFQLTTFSFKS